MSESLVGWHRQSCTKPGGATWRRILEMLQGCDSVYSAAVHGISVRSCMDVKRTLLQGQGTPLKSRRRCPNSVQKRRAEQSSQGPDSSVTAMRNSTPACNKRSLLQGPLQRLQFMLVASYCRAFYSAALPLGLLACQCRLTLPLMGRLAILLQLELVIAFPCGKQAACKTTT